MNKIHIVMLSAGAAAALALFPDGSVFHGVYAQERAPGERIYAVRCAACHNTGLLGSPKLGQSADWAPRLAQKRATLLAHVVEGFKKMPPRGGNPTLSDEEVGLALDYMLAQVSASGAPAPAGTAESRVAAAPVGAPKPEVKKVRVSPAAPSGANTFNRLMKPPSKRNPPPAKDGIHDPTSEGTLVLQAPRDSFATLPKSRSGNRVDWVKALDQNKIAPRYDRINPDAKPVIMDLNIVREVKGSMPDVVYPHKQHTQWLDCSNCHPAIFVPKKGANQMSMAGILLGKQCGVCHGKVAFPVSDCRKCHARKKPKSGG